MRNQDFLNIEVTELYDYIFQTLIEIANVDVSNFVFESDKGSCLISSCDSHRCTHLKCLQHLQVNLRGEKFGFEASELVSCRCTKDFITLTSKYNSIFSEITKKKELKSLNKTLESVGMCFKDNELEIKDADLWSQVSMLNRSKNKMPSTTNSIESQHGHLNEATPRKKIVLPFYI